MEALYYEKKDDTSVSCRLCPHHCTLRPGQSGLCRCRYNDDGTLMALSYGQCSSAALDPIEKKPLRRFHPGRPILSLGSWGCNLHCSFCQNWTISQEQPETAPITPDWVVTTARREAARHGNLGVAYTYNEPTTWYEFIAQTAPLIHEAGFKNVMVSNGYIEREPLTELLPYIDAWNIDLKSFADDFYRKICGGSLQPVQETIAAAAAVSHVEVTCLVIPGLNDSPEEMDALSAWLASAKPDIPLHITRYFPRYHMDRPATPIETLKRLASVARTHLPYVYIGNV